jgi:hypothetical protein
MSIQVVNPYWFAAAGGGGLDELMICGGYTPSLSSWETYTTSTSVFNLEASSMSYDNHIMAGGGTKTSGMLAGGSMTAGNTANSQTNTAGTWTTNAYVLPAALAYTCGGGSPTDFLVCGGSGHGNIYANACWENGSGAWVSGGTMSYQAYAKGYGGNATTGILAGGNGVGGSSGYQAVTETYASSTWTTSGSVLQAGRYIFGMDGNVDGAIYVNGYGALGYGQGNQCGTWTGGAAGNWTTITVMPTVTVLAAGNTVCGTDQTAVGGTGAGSGYVYIPYMFEWDTVTWTRVGDLNVPREYAAGGMSN